MEKGFCLLRDAASGLDILVNVHKVLYMAATGNPLIWSVHFGGDDVIAVTGTLDQITTQLRNAIP